MHSRLRSFSSCLILAFLVLGAKPAAAQDWFRTALGMDANKPRLAIADLAARSDSAKPHASLFTKVVRDDLQFSGILELASPSFYPPQAPSVPAELKPAVWIDPPTNANFLGFGNLSESTAEVAIEAWLYDVRSPSSQAVVGKVYRGAPTDAQVRKFAHQFADEIISKLSGGLPGVAATQIAFVSSRGGAKEIWVMDYRFRSLRGGRPTLHASPSPASLPISASPARKSACSPWTPANSSPSRAFAAQISRPRGRLTGRRSFFRPRCRAIPNSTSRTSMAAAPNA